MPVAGGQGGRDVDADVVVGGSAGVGVDIGVGALVLVALISVVVLLLLLGRNSSGAIPVRFHHIDLDHCNAHIILCAVSIF